MPEGIVHVGSSDYFKPVALQSLLHHDTNRFVIIDDQNSGGSHAKDPTLTQPRILCNIDQSLLSRFRLKGEKGRLKIKRPQSLGFQPSSACLIERVFPTPSATLVRYEAQWR